MVLPLTFSSITFLFFSAESIFARKGGIDLKAIQLEELDQHLCQLRFIGIGQCDSAELHNLRLE